MKKILSTAYNAGLANTWLLLLRVAASLLMLTHGYPKFQKLVGNQTIQFADPFSLGTYPSFILVVFAEFFCSLFIILGLGTRVASLFIIVTMAVAGFYVHANDPFGKKELAFLYLLVFLTVLVFGPGKYSLDHAIAGKSRVSKRY